MLLAFHSSEIDFETNVKSVCQLADALLKNSSTHWSVDALWHFRQENASTYDFVEELKTDFRHEGFALTVEPLGISLYKGAISSS